LANKWRAGCAAGILNAPDPAFDPAADDNLVRRYGPEDHPQGKRANKTHLQRTLGLIEDPAAPLFYWPSRLDNIQKGCQLLAEILYRLLNTYWDQNLQLVFVANGEFQAHFRDIVAFHRFHERVAICDFDVHLEHLTYGAADFLLMPSRFEPCGLPQMIGPIYGVLPVAHDTGGIHDTITHLDLARDRGNGFLFEYFDAEGLFWAIQQAMAFYNQPPARRAAHITRIMAESKSTFNHGVTARHYIELYERMLHRPLVVQPMYGEQEKGD